jgi:hypothetical protein
MKCVDCIVYSGHVALASGPAQSNWGCVSGLLIILGWHAIAWMAGSSGRLIDRPVIQLLVQFSL